MSPIERLKILYKIDAMMPKMVDILLVGFLLAGILIKPLTCQSLNETKCLTYLDEVRETLGSKVPPINDSRMTDNYYNISRALFPSVDLPALYVRVTIQFLKDYQNGTKIIDDQRKNLKFTWSKACSYVSVKHISLYAMSVFSLLTIYPQRRETELVMTVPPFCHNSPYRNTKSETWRYVVSMLEDIIVNPKVSDPRLNTVCCVTIGHEGGIAEYPNLWCFYWVMIVSSFLASFSLWIFFLQSIIDANTKNARCVSGAALTMTCFIGLLAFVVVVSLIACKSGKVGKMPGVYFFAYIAFCLFSFIINCCWNCIYVTSKNCMNRIGSYLLFPCLFQTVNHFLWAICGIISEPFWAIPIFLLECLCALSILFALFLYEREFNGDSSEDLLKLNEGIMRCKGCVLFHLVMCWLSFTLVLVTVALIAVGNGNAVNNPTAGAIEGVMTLIFLWLVKNSSLDFWLKNKKTSTNGEEIIPLQSS